MIAKYYQKGDSVDYTPTSAVNAGDVVVQGNLVGVAKLDIAAETLGSLAVEGVFECAKAAETVSTGDVMYYDAANQVVTKTVGTGDDALTTVFGVAIEDAEESDETVCVKLNTATVAIEVVTESE